VSAVGVTERLTSGWRSEVIWSVTVVLAPLAVVTLDVPAVPQHPLRARRYGCGREERGAAFGGVAPS